MNKVHVIVNPYSARGQTEKNWESIRLAIKAHFQEFKYVFTEKPRQATEIARELIQDGFDLIIGVGGDGTLNEISRALSPPAPDRTFSAS
jgi:diacylglycerol kinase (ATP)